MSQLMQQMLKAVQKSIAPANSKSGNSKRRTRPEFDTLEDRVVMTTGLSIYSIDPIRYDANAKRIIIEGSNSADRASVTLDARGSSVYDDQVVVSLNRGGLQYTERFNLYNRLTPAVRQVNFYGYAGNDFFENRTHLTSLSYGHAGNDTLVGGSSTDIMYGGNDNDYVNGGRGNDYLYGDAGHDLIRGKHGTDRIYGGSGNDTVDGGRHNDKIYGGSGLDNLYGGYHGDDWIEGGGGNDVINGGTGHDKIFGQSGNDWIVGGSGNDYLSGGADNDTVFGGDGQDHLYGDGGNDQLYGNAENDFMDGGDGNDLAVGDGGNDLIHGGAGHDTLTGAAGDDVIHGGTGDDNIRGSQDNDVLFGGDGWDAILGGSGNDKLIAGDGMKSTSDGDYDYLYGESGTDEFWIGDYTWYTTKYKDRIEDDVKGEKVHRDGGPLDAIKPILRVVSPSTYVSLEIVEWLVANVPVKFDPTVKLPPQKFGSYVPFQFHRYH